MAAPLSTRCKVLADAEHPVLPGGAAPYGNFPNYSCFHPPEGRVCLLPATLLSELFPSPRVGPLLGLDVGCNSGELSVALYKHLLGFNHSNPEHSVDGKDFRLLCCDIDADLIERAKQHSPFPGSISYTALDFMDPSARETLLTSYLNKFGRCWFDICFCMSITMWIHLNHGDSGLVKFLSCLATKCTYLLLEPQPWKCYRAAARRLRKLGRNDFDHFHSLTIKGNMAEKITQILTRDCAMEFVCCFGSTSWDRSLLLFKSKEKKHLGPHHPTTCCPQGWKSKCSPDVSLQLPTSSCVMVKDAGSCTSKFFIYVLSSSIPAYPLRDHLSDLIPLRVPPLLQA